MQPMNVTEGSSNKCSQKTALSLFFFLELIAYVLSCIALISPSWQYVYLENGRTEHHHGLWLDCKRDYSHDYGRSREYYETLYRLDKQQSPFDQFFLTSLMCVYKFDYYIDNEDLYDHNHDENRLQDDANQHLPLGWKIASLAALVFAALTASAALLFSIYAFCHRTFICAAAVLVTVAALLSSVGLLVFYIWGNYQDNNIIKEEDGTYQQYFGWALYMQVAGTVIQLLASIVGYVVTSIAFRKTRTKLIKIEVVDDNSTLLDRTSSLPLKRSFWAIYKLDSAALEKWEKDYLNMVQSGGIAEEHAKSIPNYKWKKQQQNSLENEITKSISSSFTNFDQSNLCAGSGVFTSASKSILKASKQLSTISNVVEQLNDRPDLTYEHLPGDIMEKSRSAETNKLFSAISPDTNFSDQIKDVPGQLIHSESSINIYDKVYECITDISKLHDREEENNYRKKIAIYADGISLYSEKEQVSDEDVARSTLINDVPVEQLPCSNAAATEFTFFFCFRNILVGTVREISDFICTNCCTSSPSPMILRYDINGTFAKTCAALQPNAAILNMQNCSDRNERCLENGIHRPVDSLSTFENKANEKNNSQWDEAQFCLNLFMNGRVAPLLNGSSASDALSETKKSSITTV
uniref:Clc-like protein n=1 Tax=Setaria digitata TaxID=48799 RepID=A0A915PBJ8_9BILA